MNITPKNRKKHPVSAHVCRQGQRYEPCWHVSRGFFKSLKKTCWLTFCSHLCSVSLWFSQHGYCFCLTAVHFTSRGLIAFHLSVSVLIHGSQRLVVAILKEILMSWKLLSTLYLFPLAASPSDASTRAHYLPPLQQARWWVVASPYWEEVGCVLAYSSQLKYADHPQFILSHRVY